MIKNKKEAEDIISWADWLKTQYTDFRATGADIMLLESQNYLRNLAPKSKCLVGIHGRNDKRFYPIDFEVLKRAKIECIKMMSHTDVSVFEQIKREFPSMKIITRLYDDRFGVNNRVSPVQFMDKMSPIIKNLLPYCIDFECHNEPNHPAGYEGWNVDDASALDFNAWFLTTYNLLKIRFPHANFGFPGLAVPHRDMEWLRLCKEAVNRADFLSCHSYWQNPNCNDMNHLSGSWGLNFIRYHQVAPHKLIHITEAGCSNAQSNLPLPDEMMSRNITEHLMECQKHDYVGSVSYFILSSQDSAWSSFAWRMEDGRIKQVVNEVGNLLR